jgi:hypothetical protein
VKDRRAAGSSMYALDSYLRNMYIRIVIVKLKILRRATVIHPAGLLSRAHMGDPSPLALRDGRNQPGLPDRRLPGVQVEVIFTDRMTGTARRAFL